MRLVNLELSSFRNLRDCSLFFKGRTISVIGKNGQGKTNLLEAVCMAVSYRSFRTSDRSAVVNSQSEWSRLVSHVYSDLGRPIDTEVVISKAGRDSLKFNETVVRSRTQFSEIPVVSFHPPDIDLVRGGPSVRRTFIDSIASYVVTGFSGRLRKAERLLLQRNHLLSQIYRSRDRDLVVTLDVFDERLSELSSQVSDERALVVESLAEDARELYSRISAFESTLEISYDRVTAKELLSRLREAREHDIRTGTTSVGFHREDITILLDKQLVRTTGSQGEMRASVLALKFSQAHFYCRESREGPLLLLDDVFSELDSDRVSRLLGELPSYQVWVTGTSLPESWESDEVLTMESGVVREA